MNTKISDQTPSLPSEFSQFDTNVEDIDPKDWPLGVNDFSLLSRGPSGLAFATLHPMEPFIGQTIEYRVDVSSDNEPSTTLVIARTRSSSRILDRGTNTITYPSHEGALRLYLQASGPTGSRLRVLVGEQRKPCA